MKKKKSKKGRTKEEIKQKEVVKRKKEAQEEAQQPGAAAGGALEGDRMAGRLVRGGAAITVCNTGDINQRRRGLPRRALRGGVMALPAAEVALPRPPGTLSPAGALHAHLVP